MDNIPKDEQRWANDDDPRSMMSSSVAASWGERKQILAIGKWKGVVKGCSGRGQLEGGLPEKE